MISTEKKNDVLKTLSQLLIEQSDVILTANQKDVINYRGDDESMLDRLKVDDNKIQSMVDSVNYGIKLNDPEDRVLFTHNPDNGLRIENKTVPFGKILIIYESRPDVTIEAALTAFKAGNKILLKGGKEARNTNLVLTDLWHKSFQKHQVSTSFVTYLDYDRIATQELIKNNNQNIDLIIPRGGEALIQFVRMHTEIPVIVSGRGNNFLYIDESSDIDMAIDIMVDGKSRISVCNALDKVLIHKNTPDLHLKLNKITNQLKSHEIELIGDHQINKLNEAIKIKLGEEVLYEEFLSRKLYLSIVDGLDDAIEKINKYSGGHSAGVVTDNKSVADQFLQEVDCAAVYHNASTRFTDGGQFGFGAEMAISTQKVHFRGPVAIDQLVTNKWFIYGTGQIRS